MTHWSAYDYNTYTVNVPLPAVPTLSASASSANGRNDLQTASNAGTATTDFIQIQASYDGEVTWQDVRTWLGGGLLATWASTPDLSDYEAPNGSLRQLQGACAAYLRRFLRVLGLEFVGLCPLVKRGLLAQEPVRPDAEHGGHAGQPRHRRH